jgi:cellulose synthase/poly-beta-1,6-N-acetylglucosamine synthase-like glycosyltransferase
MICGFDNINIPDTKSNVNYVDFTNQRQTHSQRLNHLFNVTNNGSSNDDDVLIFMDSDCFPIKSWVDYVVEKLKTNPIVAIQRSENFSAPLGCIPEVHPHPCFFATTFGFWRKNNLSFDDQETTGYSLLNFLSSNNCSRGINKVSPLLSISKSIPVKSKICLLSSSIYKK